MIQWASCPAPHQDRSFDANTNLTAQCLVAIKEVARHRIFAFR